MYYIDDKKIKETKALIVEIMRDPNYMFNDSIRGTDNIYGQQDMIDLMDLIAYLYELIHELYYNKEYHYMFHWANKCGSWVEEETINDIINDRINMRCDK